MIIDCNGGDLLESNCDVLVNTVNCKGVMGAGIAAQFKQQYPLMFKEYEKECKYGNYQPGVVQACFLYTPIIINFPTKDHWKDNSKIEWIKKGLDSMAGMLAMIKGSYPIQNIAIPPLGCGLGGLDWNEVKPLIVECCNFCDRVNLDIDFWIFNPYTDF